MSWQSSHEKGVTLRSAGSGVLQDLSKYGLQGEPIIAQACSGADVVSFSGDKLLGGPQAGLIVGSRTIIERLRKHSLYRALRVDKLTLAALQATLNAHRRGTLFNEIPSLQMLALTKSDIARRSEEFIASLDQKENSSELSITLIEGESAIGGGSGPSTHPATLLLALEHTHHSADELDQRLRRNNPTIIGRVSEGKLLLDLRTVFPAEEPDLARALKDLVN